MRSNQLRWLGLSAVIFALDQITKIWVTHTIAYGQVKTILPFLNIILSYNAGAAFGFLHLAGGWQRWFFIIVALVISLVIISFLYRLPRKDNWTGCAMGLILGGAIGNLYDRVTLGMVRDFIDFHINNWHFATFNIADSAVCIGIGLWILITFFSKTEGE